MTTKSIALIFDFDYTCTEELSQTPIFSFFDKELKKEYGNDYNSPFDFFKILNAKKEAIISANPTARIQSGITWISEFVRLRSEKIIDCSDEKIKETSKKIKLSNGMLSFFSTIKKIWKEKGVEIKIYIVSVSMKLIIEGALENVKEYIDGIHAIEVYDNKICSVVEDFSKTEIAFEIAKGGGNRDKKLLTRDYKIPYNSFIVIGDGFSDVPSWRFYHKLGAKCIMVYKKGNLEEYEKAMKNAYFNADYVLERDYTPSISNPTWRYINSAISDIVYRKCLFSYELIHKFRYGKEMSEEERNLIEKHIETCPEHEIGLKLIHIIPQN